MSERGVCTLSLCSLATVTSCINASVRIVTKSPKGRTSVLIFSISLLVGNSFQWPPQGGEQGPTACPMYIDPGSSRNASPAPRGGLVSPPPFEQQQQFRAPQQQQQQYAAPQQQQFNAPQQQQFNAPQLQKPVASLYTEQAANNNVNGLNKSSYAFPQQQHQSFQQQSQTYHQTSSIVSSNSNSNNNSVSRPVGATSGAAAVNLAQNLASKASAGPGQYAAPPAGSGPGPKAPAAGPTGGPGQNAPAGPGQNAPAGPGQNVSAPTRGRGVLTQQKPGMRVPMCGACEGQIRCTLAWSAVLFVVSSFSILFNYRRPPSSPPPPPPPIALYCRLDWNSLNLTWQRICQHKHFLPMWPGQFGRFTFKPNRKSKTTAQRLRGTYARGTAIGGNSTGRI